MTSQETVDIDAVSEGDLIAFGENEIMDNDVDGSVVVVNEHAEALRKDVRELKTNIENSYFIIAEKLHEIQDKEYFKDYGYKTLWDYANEEVGFEKRKCQYFLNIHRFFTSLEEVGKTDKVEDLKLIGWSKVKEVTTIPEAIANIDYWIKEMQVLSVRELLSVKKSYEQELRDQAIASGDTDAPASTPVEKNDDRDNTTKFSVTLHNDQYAALTEAFKIAEKIAGSDSKAKMIETLASSFIANESDDLEKSLSALESVKEINIIAIKDGDIVYGEELLSKVSSEA